MLVHTICFKAAEWCRNHNRLQLRHRVLVEAKGKAHRSLQGANHRGVQRAREQHQLLDLQYYKLVLDTINSTQGPCCTKCRFVYCSCSIVPGRNMQVAVLLAAFVGLLDESELGEKSNSERNY